MSRRSSSPPAGPNSPRRLPVLDSTVDETTDEMPTHAPLRPFRKARAAPSYHASSPTTDAFDAAPSLRPDFKHARAPAYHASSPTTDAFPSLSNNVAKSHQSAPRALVKLFSSTTLLLLLLYCLFCGARLSLFPSDTEAGAALVASVGCTYAGLSELKAAVRARRDGGAITDRELRVQLATAQAAWEDRCRGPRPPPARKDDAAAGAPLPAECASYVAAFAPLKAQRAALDSQVRAGQLSRVQASRQARDAKRAIQRRCGWRWREHDEL